MSRQSKTPGLSAGVLVTAMIAASLIYVGSVQADRAGVGEDREILSLSVGDGPGQIGYVEGNDDVEAWAPGRSRC